MVSNKDYFVGYKSAGNYIVVLHIPFSSKTNMKRSGIVNYNFASYRCEFAHVVDILEKDTIESIDSIASNYNPNFIYMKNTRVECVNFDNEPSNTNSRGIHFFTSIDAAYHFEKNNSCFHNNKKFVAKSWFDNGQIELVIEYINGIKNGIYKEYHENGILFEESKFENGIRVGQCNRCYTDGEETSVVFIK